MKHKLTNLMLIVGAIVLLGLLAVAQHDMPAGMSHADHLAKMKKDAEMKKRGNAAMGFDQDKTTHHFFLSRDGGSIQVKNNAANDTESRDLIRQHLRKISEQFAKGDFSSPFATHQEVIPGVTTMHKLTANIQYTYEDLPGGAIVRIKSENPKAVRAVHDFLTYQIREHSTGDPGAVRE